LDAPRREVGALPSREPRLEARELLFQHPFLLALRLELFFQCVARRLIEPLDEVPLVLHRLHPGKRSLAGGRLDATHARRDAALRRDLEEADVAGAGDVRAAAQLARGADVQNAHLVAVFLAEQGHGTAFDRVAELPDA